MTFIYMFTHHQTMKSSRTTLYPPGSSKMSSTQGSRDKNEEEESCKMLIRFDN